MVHPVPTEAGPSALSTAARTIDAVHMFVRYFAELPLPFDVVDETVLRDPEAWIPGLARDADRRGEELMVEVGFGSRGHRVTKTVSIGFGEPVRFPSKTVLPLTWSASGPGHLLPSLDADLEVAPLGESRSQLSISARYEPPLGGLGRTLDRALLHRVAEATIRDFLEQASASITTRLHAPA
jgi:hypothetical protein